MIIDIVLVYAAGRGGLEDVITSVSQGLAKRGHRVRVIQSYPSQNLQWEESLPEFHYYGMKNNLNSETIQSLAFGYENLLMDIGKPDLVLATHAPSLSYICRSALADVPGKTCPVISWLHAPPEYFGNADLLKYSDAHFAISSQIEKSIEKNVFPGHPLFYIGNPVKINNNLIYRSKDKLELIFIGRIHQHDKRLDILLRGLQFLDGDWRLRLIGEGPDEAQIKELSTELGINSNIEWLGWQENPWETIDEASLLVLSSDYEGFGLVLVEALSRGIPVVSTSCSGPLDIVEDGKNGWLYPIGDYKALGSILNDIISGKKILPTPETCVNSVKRFDTEEVINNIQIVVDIYKNNEVSNNVNNNYLAKDNYYQFSTSIKNILTKTIQGIEYLGTTRNCVDHTLLEKLFTSSFLNVLNIDKNELNVEDENIKAFVCYPKVEYINYHFSKARVKFLLINKGISQNEPVHEKLKYHAKLVNDEGVWKIDGLELLEQSTSVVKNTIENTKKKILLVKTNNFGSNTLALYKNVPAKFKEDYDIELINQSTSEDYINKVKNADVLVLTEANVTVDKNYTSTNQIIVELWHGFPFKVMGYADKNESNLNFVSDRWKQIDYMVSYSTLYNQLMYECLHMDPDIVQITGMPRNDLLLNSVSNNKDILERIFSLDTSGKSIAFFMPTYRKVMFNDRQETSLVRENLFGLKNFSYEELNIFLKQNNIELFIKLHPIEERMYQDQLIGNFEHLHIITDSILFENNLDLYELLGATDILLTDYSSVFFDYLLLNKPLMFLPVDKEEYSDNRGFILSDYERWTPGPKIYNQQDLQVNMLQNLSNPELYKSNREEIRDLVHQYTTNDSSKRVWEFIQKISSGENVLAQRMEL
ncbi:CDP-glycerol glycerophosphotransferase family protein [Niallia sp. FSL R7-0271]|uniref:CDP-glycerol glycerophosphotransferase family protein n=1 Tax=Niallia sp. FSL R7-0271 TaxID=2921678 RepID=UPI0030FB1FB2